MARLLVVDDEPDIRESIAEVLESGGYEVQTARDGRDALDKVAGERFAAILLDLMMPNVSGWQFREIQLRDPRIAEIPVIVVSAAWPPCQASRVLGKPFDIDELLRTIRVVLEQPAAHA